MQRGNNKTHERTALGQKDVGRAPKGWGRRLPLQKNFSRRNLRERDKHGGGRRGRGVRGDEVPRGAQQRVLRSVQRPRRLCGELRGLS